MRGRCQRAVASESPHLSHADSALSLGFQKDIVCYNWLKKDPFVYTLLEKLKKDGAECVIQN